MLWDKSQPAAEVRSRPYQGVRVKDPVRELLRRKRTAAPPTSKTTAPTVEVGPSISQGLFSSSESPAALSEGCSGWRAVPASSCSVQPSLLPWSAPDCSPQDGLAPSQSYSVATALSTGTDLYMQTLCPSYTMLTYTHAPLLTNFGTIPVAPVPTPLPQMDTDSGLTYLPWTTMSSPTALSGSSLLHVPLSMSLATMIPQLDPQVSNVDSQILGTPLQPVTEGPSEGQSEEEDHEKQESPSLLDKLLEEQKADDEEEDKDLYSDSIYVTNV
ncbi:POU domain class 2-associating factor 1 [Periophthalmus magnuspinnatus]|uniref:POU domain class 2-associating factor 1 n=1 Tax=Periophthalmus magnuspinnatus TaxID=409849 RepID=UPI00145A0E2E|nr:POU domain class 2-associating factor 1 [Periophthalmus magnuspinnatus]